MAPGPPSIGFYVVLTVDPAQQLEESRLQQIATRADLKLSDLQSALKARRPLTVDPGKHDEAGRRNH